MSGISKAKDFQLYPGVWELTPDASIVTPEFSVTWSKPNVSIGGTFQNFSIGQWVESTERLAGPKLAPIDQG